MLQALRSGVINAEDSYRFEVPSTYREVGVANIQSGNFCMVLLCHYLIPADDFISLAVIWEDMHAFAAQLC